MRSMAGSAVGLAAKPPRSAAAIKWSVMTTARVRWHTNGVKSRAPGSRHVSGRDGAKTREDLVRDVGEIRENLTSEANFCESMSIR